jgi:hypothetical protein
LFDFCSKSESSTTELCHSLLDVKRNHLAFASPCLKKSGGVSLPPSGRVIAVCATAEVANITRESWAVHHSMQAEISLNTEPLTLRQKFRLCAMCCDERELGSERLVRKPRD